MILRSSLVGLLLLSTSTMAQAEGVSLSFSAFYAGAYASNFDEVLTAADPEYGLSLGYRGDAGGVSHDLGVVCYLYDEAFPDIPVEDYAKTYASGTSTLTETLHPTALADLAPEYDQTDLSLRADYDAAVEGLSVGAILGRLDADYAGWTCWSLDAAYALGEQVSLGPRYQDSNVDPALGLFNTDGFFAASVSFDL